VIAGAFLALGAALAQTPPPPTFAASVAAVYLDVVVVQGGQPITGLQGADFEVRDQGVVQDVRLARHEDVPLTVVLVFDASASVRGQRLADLKAAGRALLAGLRQQDEAALVAFSHELAVVAPQGTDRTAVQWALAGVQASGATAVWDALYAGLKLPRSRGRALVVMFTDGEDNMSWLSADEVRRVAEQSNAVVHVVTLKDPLGLAEAAGSRALRRIAEGSGGRVWTAGASKDLQATFLRVLSEMQSAYLLTYEPSGVSGQGWHRIEVKLKASRGTLRTRRGYLVPAPPAR
jgi:Ca-activated chloride channel family protein